MRLLEINADGNINKLNLCNKIFLFDGNGPKIIGIEDYPEVKSSVSFEERIDEIKIKIRLENTGHRDVCTKISLYTGIDTYMAEFPEWNSKLFPTMLRCEKTHFYGYCMSPLGDILGIACPDAIASYRMLYNGDGHRIKSVEIDLINPAQLPDRYPKDLNVLKRGEILEREIYLYLVKSLSDFNKITEQYIDAPIISANKWTVEKGERLYVDVGANVNVKIYSPSNVLLSNGDVAKEYGTYTIIAERGRKFAQSYIFCRKNWDFYLKEARKQAIMLPQKATTHTESWYGLFSGYLAAKHYPDEILDAQIENKFSEIMPYMFDMENGEPLVIIERVQNTAAMISLLVDRYEASNKKDIKSLDLANKLFEFLYARQREDGAYMRNGTSHYTCVIYIAKSILELYLAEKDIHGMKQRAKKHFDSAKKAIDNLVELLDDIGTEGEQTFEDGMVSCSALQIAMFALLIDELDRKKYIDAAEFMLNKHLCLEQKLIPDCRMRNGSLRYWEAQYDVLTKPNMMNSPHGWTAWTMYAKYYLYLLTGKVEYLKDLMDGMGACVQLMDLNGNLRWGFVCDPYIDGEVFVKDKKLSNGYSGKHINQRIGEQYFDMISGWYTAETQKPTGGYLGCPLFLKDRTIEVDNQGGCCDNDVHEVFKCLEETVLKKAFFHLEENNKEVCYSCRGIGNEIVTDNEVNEIIVYIYKDLKIYINGKSYFVKGKKVTKIII